MEASGGHTGGASGAVHQGPQPLGAHQRGPGSNFFEKLIFFCFSRCQVTVATAERSFSKLKLIKTYLRKTMQDDRLSGLAVLSIENAEARKLDVSKIIDDFASRKARRRKF